MIRIIRHFCVSLWTSCMVSIPLSLYAFVRLNTIFPGMGPGWVGAIVIPVCFAFTALCFDLSARAMIRSLLKEADVWEQSGFSKRSENRYLKALRVYDSFLIFPLTARGIGTLIVHGLARHTPEPELGNQAMIREVLFWYLRQHPEDELVAEVWLTRLRNHPKKFQSRNVSGLLTDLTERYHSHKTISPLLAGAFLVSGRTDYPARKVFANILKAPNLKAEYREQIERLTGTGKTDTDGLKTTDPAGFMTLGEYAGLSSEPEDGPGPIHPSAYSRKTFLFKGLAAVAAGGAALVLTLLRMVVVTILWGGISWAGTTLARLYAVAADLIRSSENLGRTLRISVVSLVLIALSAFIVNTVSHVQTPSAPPREIKPVEVEIPKPFTIQVAAYLKPAHADRFVATLKKEDIPAQVKQIPGGGKTWYVVRVSAFPDKASAEAFGKQLKDRKMIEEFFVCNR